MSPFSDHENPRVALLAHDAHVEALLARVLSHVRVEDGADARAAWKTFLPELLAHLDAEEMYVLPGLDAEDGVECDHLRAEHARIRRDVGEIAVALEIHAVRPPQIESLSALLREHAVRELGILYAHAERRLPISTVRSLVAHLRNGVTTTTGGER